MWRLVGCICPSLISFPHYPVFSHTVPHQNRASEVLYNLLPQSTGCTLILRRKARPLQLPHHFPPKPRHLRAPVTIQTPRRLPRDQFPWIWSWSSDFVKYRGEFPSRNPKAQRGIGEAKVQPRGAEGRCRPLPLGSWLCPRLVPLSGIHKIRTIQVLHFLTGRHMYWTRMGRRNIRVSIVTRCLGAVTIERGTWTSRRAAEARS